MALFERFFTWDNFLRYVDWQGPNSREVSHSTYDKKWFGTPNFQAAMDLARFGWTEFLDKIKPKDLEDFKIQSNMELWETKNSVVGSGVDIGRYMMGLPDCMQYQDTYLNEKFHVSPKFVNIVVNVCYSWTFDFDYILERGLKIVETINQLEMNNVKTRVILLENSEKYDNLYRIYIPIKDYQDIFYLEKLMFPIAHTSFLRRLVFSAEEREPGYIRDICCFYKGGGYGTPSDKFKYDSKTTLYFGAEVSYSYVNRWIKEVINGDPKDYAGNTEFDKHLQDLQYQTNKQNVDEELKKYAEEHVETFKEIYEDQERRKRIKEARTKKHFIKPSPTSNGDTENQNQENGKGSQQSSTCDNCGDNKQENKSNEKQQNKKQKKKNKEKKQDNKSQQNDKSQDQKKSLGCNNCKNKNLPVLKQSCLPVLWSHYNKQKSGLPVLLSFYEQNQLSR